MRLRAALIAASDAAVAEQALVTVGIVPAHPDTGLGYIEPGEAVSGSLRRVARFVEKPDRARAERLGFNAGGAISIHGLPAGYGPTGPGQRMIDWTDGCIAVTNADMATIRLVLNMTHALTPHRHQNTTSSLNCGKRPSKI